MFLKIRFYSIRLLFFLTIVSIGLLVTGSAKRDYKIANPDQEIMVSGTIYRPVSLASKYLPGISISGLASKDHLDSIFFEVVEEDQEVIVNYYFKWSAENNPNPIANIASKIWRLVYFRFALSDVEFVQLNIDKNTGKIRKAKTRNDNLKNVASTPCLSVNSWSHDFNFCEVNTAASTDHEKLLSYFEDSNYKHLKMARRSQGDYSTKDNVMNYPFIIFLALLATYYFRHLQKDYNNEYAETA